MKLRFKDWVDTGHFSKNADHLFNSSITCYKAEANTAALIMGYLGFLVVLKERIMKATKPAIYDQHAWNDIINNLKDEDRWEEQVFSTVMAHEKLNGAKQVVRERVFVFNESVRNQIRYWKDRRNDCAHHKDNIIGSSHVESFWVFLESNLPKISIGGGMITLLNKFERHFDTAYTPADADIFPLVLEIREAVEKSELDEFWQELVDKITDYHRELIVFENVFKMNDEYISESLLAYLKKNEAILLAYIDNHPEFIARMQLNEADMRNLWYDKLYKRRRSIEIYAAMLRNNLIPQNEIGEANERLALQYKYTSNIVDHFILEKHGFGEVLYRKLFVDKDPADYRYWQFMNEHYELFTVYVEMFELTNEVVEVLAQQLDKTMWNPLFLQQHIDRLFASNAQKKKEFKDKVAALGLQLPSQINSLSTD